MEIFNMKLKYSFIFFLLLVLIFNCNFKNSSPSDKKNIEKLINDYTTAFDNKDFKTFSSFCTDDMLFFTLDGQMFDRTSMIPFLNRILKRWNNLHTTIENLDIQIDSFLAFARYKTQLDYISGDNEGVMNNLITVTFKKKNSAWKIAHFHMSTGY